MGDFPYTQTKEPPKYNLSQMEIFDKVKNLSFNYSLFILHSSLKKVFVLS